MTAQPSHQRHHLVTTDKNNSLVPEPMPVPREQALPHAREQRVHVLLSPTVDGAHEAHAEALEPVQDVLGKVAAQDLEAGALGPDAAGDLKTSRVSSGADVHQTSW